MNLIAGFVLLTYVCAFAVPADVGERPVGGARSAVDGRVMGRTPTVCPTGGSSPRDRVEARTAASPSSAPAEASVRTDAENIVWMLVSTHGTACSRSQRLPMSARDPLAGQVRRSAGSKWVERRRLDPVVGRPRARSWQRR